MAAIFTLNPIISIFLNFVAFTKTSTNYWKQYFMFFIAIYLGLINTTIDIYSVSDLKSYYDLYRSSTNFSMMIKSAPYEILYTIFTYLMYYLTDGNFRVFILIFTIIVYQLVFVSLDKVFNNISDNKMLSIYAVLIFAFYHPHFLQSLNLMRQILAGSIFFYFFIERFKNNRTLWYLPIIAILTHRSSALLFLIAFIPLIGKNLIFKSVIVISLSSIILFFSFPFINSLLLLILSPFPSMHILLDGLQDLESTNYLWYDGSQAKGIRQVYFGIFILFILMFNKIKSLNLNYIFNFVLIYIFVLEFFYNSGLILLHLRMAIYLNYFIPIGLVMMIAYVKNDILSKLLGLSLVVVIFYRFFNALDKYAISYDGTLELLFYPLINYL